MHAASTGADSEGSLAAGEQPWLEEVPALQLPAAPAPKLSSVATALCVACGASHIGNVAVLRGGPVSYRPGSRGASSSRRRRYFPFTCMVGPHWPCLCVSISLIVGPGIPFLVLVAPRLHAAVLACGIIALVASLGSLLVTACSDPGVALKQNDEEKDAQARGLAERGELETHSVCATCNIYRAPGTQHCYDCNACIVGLDHHCPWTGKCIGAYNLRPFYTFLITTLVLILYAGGCMIAYIIQEVTSSAKQ